MSTKELPKAYEPKSVEERWYAFWLEKNYFHAKENGQGLPFSIVIPPPNVTGSLHIGHALNSTLQDILVRWMRMSGRNTLWVPGTDHAGIATQNVVERQLAKDNVDRHALGREGFIEKVWEWKKEYGGRIINQLNPAGISLMRIWSIHPQHLDAKGLVALWRETLLAQKVLLGETRGYRNHPQLKRFKVIPIRWPPLPPICKRCSGKRGGADMTLTRARSCGKAKRPG